jgi:hypothetical protein
MVNSSSTIDNGASHIEEDVDAVTIEQQKMSPDMRDYIAELGKKKPFIKDISLDSRHIILELSKFWPVLPGRKTQAAKLWKEIEDIILSNTIVKVSPMVMVRIAVGRSEISATALPDPNQSGIIASFNVVEGILRRYMVPPSDKAQVSEEMGVPSGLVVTCQPMAMLFNPLGDNRKLGMGAGNLYTERSRDITVGKNDPNEEQPITTSPNVALDYPQHVPPAESTSGLARTIEAAAAIEGVKKLEEEHRKEEERRQNEAREKELSKTEMAGIAALAEEKTNAEREITTSGEDDGNGSAPLEAPSRPENGSLDNSESSISQQEREQWEGTTEMERRSLEGITEQEREAREGTTEMERESEDGIQFQDQEEADGITEQEQRAQEGIGEQEEVAQEGIAEQELEAQDGIVEQERRAQEGIGEQEQLAQEGSTAMERAAQESATEMEQQAQGGSTEMERAAQESATEMEQQAQGGSTEMERAAQESSTEMEQQAQEGSTEIERQAQEASTELEQRGQEGSTGLENEGQENSNGIESRTQEGSTEIEQHGQEYIHNEQVEQPHHESSSTHMESDSSEHGPSHELHQEEISHSETGHEQEHQATENHSDIHLHEESSSSDVHQGRHIETQHDVGHSRQETVSHEPTHQTHDQAANNTHEVHIPEDHGSQQEPGQGRRASFDVHHDAGQSRYQSVSHDQMQQPHGQTAHTTHEVHVPEHSSTETQHNGGQSIHHTASHQQTHQGHDQASHNIHEVHVSEQRGLQQSGQGRHSTLGQQHGVGQSTQPMQSRTGLHPSQVPGKDNSAAHMNVAHTPGTSQKVNPSSSSRSAKVQATRGAREQIKTGQGSRSATALNAKTKAPGASLTRGGSVNHQNAPQPSTNGKGVKLREKKLAASSTPRRSEAAKKLSSRAVGSRPTTKTALLQGTKLSSAALSTHVPGVASPVGIAGPKYMGVKIAADKAQSVAHTRRKRLTAYKGVQQKVKSSVAQQKSITKQAAQMAPQISQKGLQKLTPD